MRRARHAISMLLVLTGPWLSGCHSTHAQPTPLHRSAARAPVPSAPLAKHPSRDPAFALYNNSAYGVTFRYPRNYLLEEQPDSEERSSLLAEQQPRSMLVSTVTIPPDAYPNTTFRTGTLELLVYPAVSLETCQSFAAPDTDADTSGTTAAQSTLFTWRQRGSAAAGSGFLDREYSAFSGGTCYEFLLQVATSGNPDGDSSVKPANESKIVRQLDKIVSSLQLHPPQPARSW